MSERAADDRSDTDRPTLDELAALIVQALRDDDPDAFVEDVDHAGRSAIDGRFDLIRVAKRVQAALAGLPR